MEKLSKIKNFLDKELKIKSIEDSSKNGLQVKSNKEIKKIGFAVDACMSTIERAKKSKVDLLIVHHGIKWAGLKDSMQLKKKTIELLNGCNMSLYACHLPLDKHEKYGNNIQLAKILDLKNIKKFGKYHSKSIGYKGEFKKPLSIKQLTNKLNDLLKTQCTTFNFGKKQIKSIGIVSGGGSSALKESLNLDCFLTGDALYHIVIATRDLNHNMILARHYATETLGVKALMPILKEKFNISTIFINNDTGV